MEVFEVVEVFLFGDGGVGEKTKIVQRGRSCRREKSSSCRQWNATREFQKYLGIDRFSHVRQILFQHDRIFEIKMLS